MKNIGENRATLALEVRNELERMIVEGDLQAGEKLNELKLSNTMGVSRGTVREAIRSLAGSGLVDIITNRGAFVHNITLTEVQKLYELRGAIFAMACSACARRVSKGLAPDLPKNLAANIAEMEGSMYNHDNNAYYQLNIAFHNLLLEGSGNVRAIKIYDALVKEMHLFRRRGLSIATNIKRSLEEHRSIAKAVETGDAENAYRAAEQHITHGLNRYMNIAQQHEQGIF